jgi:hypothetical protein
VQREAVFAYSGNVYDKLNAIGMDDVSLLFLQKRTRNPIRFIWNTPTSGQDKALSVGYEYPAYTQSI